ncbi:hypothetical protein TELCIR_11521 [Teladorsagia circumcincta]|uniref:CRAL-TRIO domain-containing protein n=1 Tax=Teladorsagia circumcincta TaxID=45464 RepID=A0A2G9U966_TELCI|nr:hypothetical protein TELCIR_11521 [Teladorsagia circumcincta]
MLFGWGHSFMYVVQEYKEETDKTCPLSLRRTVKDVVLIRITNTPPMQSRDCPAAPKSLALVMNKEEAQAVKRLRSENSDLLSEKYGTDFNLLRWAQGYGFDMEEASAQLRRHLKFRKFYDLDNFDKIPEHAILKQYFPIGLVGPYRILWASVYTNYPEWIKTCYIVNAPPFMGLIWKALGPLLPERTRNKVQLWTANSDWKNQIQKVAKPENIPAYWGGKMYDANGDGMCRAMKEKQNVGGCVDHVHAWKGFSLQQVLRKEAQQT